MITYLKNGKSLAEKENDNQKTKETVEKILKQIELGGDKTVRDLSNKFDNYNPISFKLTADQIDDLIKTLSERELQDIKFAQQQVRNFAEIQRASMSDVEVETLPGVILGHKNIPVNTAGCYVPAGSSRWLRLRICLLQQLQLQRFNSVLAHLLLKVSQMPQW